VVIKAYRKFIKTYNSIKSRKNKLLDLSSKAYNKKLSSERIGVEHKIRELKILKMVGQTYRNILRGYGLKMNIIAGLVNFKHGF